MGLGHVEPWDQRRGFSCHPSLSLCLPIHLSKPRLMREQWEPPQAGPSISKAQSEGRGVREDESRDKARLWVSSGSETSRLRENPDSAQKNNGHWLRDTQQVHSGAGADAGGPGMSMRAEHPPLPHHVLLGPWL